MKYSELFFLYSLSQSNIHNISIFPNDNDVKRKDLSKFILVFYLKPAIEAIIKQNCYLISVDSNMNSIHSSTKNIDFPDLSGEVVSIDSLIDLETDTISIILCILKKQKENKPKSLIHIYEANLKTDEMDKFKPNLVYKKDIGYNPLQVSHTRYWNNALEKINWAFIVSISDECLYNKQKERSCVSFSVFMRANLENVLEIDSQSATSSRSSSIVVMESEKKTIRRFNEKTVKKRSELEDVENRFDESASSFKKNLYNECSNYSQCFPEITAINQKILFMDFKIIEENFRRISCFGSDTGHILMHIVDMVKAECLMSFNTEHNGPITSIRLIDSPNLYGNNTEIEFSKEHKNDYSVLVCSAIEQAVVYKNVLKNEGFHRRNQFCLKESDFYDCVLCSTVADVDMDGNMEILIGTFQQSLLVYKWYISSDNNGGVFKLVSRLKCAGPIHHIEHADITKDGLCELIVLTTRGLHIFQLDTDYVMDIITKRLSLK